MTPKEKIVAIQLIVGAEPDGDWGPKSHQALENLVEESKGQPQSSEESNDSGAMVDERSEKNIATLNPKVQPIAREFVRKANESLPEGRQLKIISGNRTYEEQDTLYAQGRTTKGPVVTNARGGQSNHNFGIAFDVGIFHGSDYLEDSSLYTQVSSIGKSLGLKWGGDWQNITDLPHYEYNPMCYPLATLRDRMSRGLDVTT